MPLSYGYLMDMLWLSYNKPSIRARYGIESGYITDCCAMARGTQIAWSYIYVACLMSSPTSSAKWMASARSGSGLLFKIS